MLRWCLLPNQPPAGSALLAACRCSCSAAAASLAPTLTGVRQQHSQQLWRSQLRQLHASTGSSRAFSTSRDQQQPSADAPPHHRQPQQAADRQQQQRSWRGFAGLGVPDRLVARLASDLSITAPTAVQAQAMPAVLSCRNVAIQSPTGSGKTLSYLLPLLTRLAPWTWPKPFRSEHPKVLIVCPTQELCMQVVRVARQLVGVRSAVQPCVGGANPTKQREALRDHKPVVLVATPGRLVKLLQKRFQVLSPAAVRPAPLGAAGPAAAAAVQSSSRPELTVVLEEADRLLAMSDMHELLPLISRLEAEQRGQQQQQQLSWGQPPRAAAAPRDSSLPVGQHLAAVLRRYQVILVSASLNASTLQSAASWTATDPLTVACSTSGPVAAPAAASGAGSGGSDNSSSSSSSSENAGPAAAGQQAASAGDVQQPQQMLPDTIAHQVLTYPSRNEHACFATVARALMACAARGNKVLVFVGERLSPVAALEQARALIKGPELELGVLSGRQPSAERASALARFNSGALQVLFTSDAFGLGLDYSRVDVVMPIVSLAASRSAYVARAGRTGRMGQRGIVLAVIPDDRLDAHQIQIKKAIRPSFVQEMAVHFDHAADCWLISPAESIKLGLLGEQGGGAATQQQHRPREHEPQLAAAAAAAAAPGSADAVWPGGHRVSSLVGPLEAPARARRVLNR